jgi:dihydrofolate reductase
MGRVIYAMNVSLDGFVETPDHSLDWSIVDDEIHSWWNEQLRGLDGSLYGRRVYELMNAYWPTADQDPAANDVMLEFAAIWNPMPKVVFSHSLERVEDNSRLVSGNVSEVLRELRTELPGDLAVAGPNLAGQFAGQGLVDEYRLVVHPVILGAGTPFWPQLDTPVPLEQVETYRFASGAVYLAYRSARSDR